jgi:hypothetical protein
MPKIRVRDTRWDARTCGPMNASVGAAEARALWMCRRMYGIPHQNLSPS